MRWSAPALALLVVLLCPSAHAEGITDRQLRRALRGASVAQTAALEAAVEANGTAREAVAAARLRQEQAELAYTAARMRLDAARLQQEAIAAERAWAETSADRGRLADLFTEERDASKQLEWRLARVELMRLRLIAAQAAFDLTAGEQAVRAGVLELVRLRTYVDLQGEDKDLMALIGLQQASLGRAEVDRHDLELALARAQADVSEAELVTERLAP